MKNKYLAAVALGAAWAVALPAWAELGGAPTYPAPQQALRQSRDLAAGAAPYTVITTTLPSGTEVREYVAPAGTVFAIAWSGPQMAPLDTLLGAYFSTYRQALDARRAVKGGGPGPAAIEASGLVVQTGGHMGAFFGRAYLPAAVPQGITASDIR